MSIGQWLVLVLVYLCAFLKPVSTVPFQAIPLSVPPDQSSCPPALTARFDADSATFLQPGDIFDTYNPPAANVCVIITGAPTIDVTSYPGPLDSKSFVIYIRVSKYSS